MTGAQSVRSLALWVSVGLLLAAELAAAPVFAPIFGEGAVLQRGKVVRVWGSGVDADDVQLRFGEQTVAVQVSGEGEWMGELAPMEAEFRAQDLELIVEGDVVAQVGGIVVGDVWLAGGQSNMAYKVNGMRKSLPESSEWHGGWDRPEIRFRTVTTPVEGGKGEAKEDSWIKMGEDTVGGFSAVAAVFAREVGESIQCPIGVIDVSWGGKPIEPFIPREQYQSTELLKRIEKLAAEERLDELAAMRGGVVIRNPEGHPSAIYDARLRPLAGYGVRGFLWYQAESNSGAGEDPREYRHKMVALVEGWRSAWGDFELPFYFVQLPSFPKGEGWVRVREEQRRALDLIPRSGMAVTIDIPEDDIHPPNKVPVGRRLALHALSDCYEVDSIVSWGPRYLRHEVVDGKVWVWFDHADGGLVVGERDGVEETRIVEGGAFKWFEVYSDGEWLPATAEIEENAVVLSCEEATNPTEVRYGWHPSPQGMNLYNEVLLPAAPFVSTKSLD